MRQRVIKPSPITGGALELRTERATVEYRGETISYEKSFYHCVDSNIEFTDEELENANLKLIYDTYRRHHGIPTAEELKEMRKRYRIPSSAMSLILGLGENQFRLYEDGTVPSLYVGKMLAFIKDPVFMRGMLESSRMLFSEKQYRKYYQAILSSMPPAKYEVEDSRLLDYEVLPSFPPSSILTNTTSIPSGRKTPYNDFCYANAC